MGFPRALVTHSRLGVLPPHVLSLTTPSLCASFLLVCFRLDVLLKGLNLVFWSDVHNSVACFGPMFQFLVNVATKVCVAT